MLKRTWVVFALLLFLQTVRAQNPQPTKEKLDRLIVYGDGFSFGVKEPENWHAETGDLARKQQVNVLFTPTRQTADHQVTIRVRVNKKVDENTVEDLNYDMQQYKKDYPAAEFSILSVAHPDYKTFAKLVYVSDRFYEYVAYVNPGSVSKFNFSVAMSKKISPATPDEWKAFQEVLESLIWLSAKPSQQ